MNIAYLSHEVIHIASATVALALFCLSALSYRKKGTQKLLFVSIAFLLFAIKEAILTFAYGDFHFLIHGMNLVILIFFALGVLR